MAFIEEGGRSLCLCHLLDGPRCTCNTSFLWWLCREACSSSHAERGACSALLGPRAQNLLAHLKQDARALHLAQLLPYWVTSGKSRPLSVSQLSQMSFGAQRHGSFPHAEGRWDSADSVCPGFSDKGCYREAR